MSDSQRFVHAEFRRSDLPDLTAGGDPAVVTRVEAQTTESNGCSFAHRLPEEVGVPFALVCIGEPKISYRFIKAMTFAQVSADL